MPEDLPRFVYLDHQASTPLDPRVRDVMLPWMEERRVGNPHSAHRAGRSAARAIETARAQAASLLGAHPSEMVFTSGATEANNLALFGLTKPGWRVIASAIEHPSILECFPELRRAGRECLEMPVDGAGEIDCRALEQGIAPGRTLASIMFANNEIGTVQDVAAIAATAHNNGALVHSDAAQMLSGGPIDVQALGLDAVSLSGHKLYGPTGVGALYVRRGLDLTPRLHGGGQQAGRRSGTVPVALSVGLGAACALAAETGQADSIRIAPLADRIFQGIKTAWPEARRNGSGRRLPGCVHMTLPSVDAEDVLLDLPDIAFSTGSACATGKEGPSHVLRAIGLSDEDAHASIRVSLGRTTTEDEIDYAVGRFREALRSKARRARLT